MKTILFTTFSLLVFQTVFAQKFDFDNFNRQRQTINKKGLLAIGGWSAANIIYGSIASSKASGSTRYFHRMNTIWNSVTLGISTFGYLTAKQDAGLNFGQSLKKQASIEKVFLANVGIDVAYIVGGFYMKERAKGSSKNPEKSKGFGESVILQGSFLLLFDALMYGIHNNHGKQLYKISEQVQFAPTQNGIGMVMQL
jgi:hypothetical protein